MARVLDEYSKKKRTKSSLLSRSAFLVLKNVKKKDPNFNYTNWINNKIITCLKDFDEIGLLSLKLEEIAHRKEKFNFDIDKERDFVINQIKIEKEKMGLRW